jgi:hypothetical protein
MRLLSVCLAALALSAASSAAGRELLPTVGGPGGIPFVEECGQGEFLTGLRGRAGAVVDAVGILCSRWDLKTQTMLGPSPEGDVHGGTGDQAASLQCRKNSVVETLALQVADNQYGSVGFIRTYCSGDGGARPRGQQDWGTNAGRSLETSCAPGQAAIGIHGRAGAYVDALGLICGPKPATAAAGR